MPQWGCNQLNFSIITAPEVMERWWKLSRGVSMPHVVHLSHTWCLLAHVPQWSIGHQEIPTEGCPVGRAASLGYGVKGCSVLYAVSQASVFIRISMLPNFFSSPPLSPGWRGSHVSLRKSPVVGAGCSCRAYSPLPLHPKLLSLPWFRLGPGVGLSCKAAPPLRSQALHGLCPTFIDQCLQWR